MSKWGLCFISIGCIFIMMSATVGYNSSLIITGVSVIILGGIMIFKGRIRGGQ